MYFGSVAGIKGLGFLYFGFAYVVDAAFVLIAIFEINNSLLMDFLIDRCFGWVSFIS